MYLFIVVAVALIVVVEEMRFGWAHRTILLAVNFRAFSPRSPRIAARLEAAKQAVAGAYAARDAARGEGKDYSLAQCQLDAAWNHLVRLGGVAFFCGVPTVSRTLRTKSGKPRLEVTLCLAVVLFAANVVAAEPMDNPWENLKAEVTLCYEKYSWWLPEGKLAESCAEAAVAASPLVFMMTPAVFQHLLPLKAEARILLVSLLFVAGPFGAGILAMAIGDRVIRWLETRGQR